MRLRNAVPPVVLVLLVGLLAGFAWLSRHPDDPRLGRAEEWPLLGPAIAWVREAYRVPDQDPALVSSDDAVEDPRLGAGTGDGAATGEIPVPAVVGSAPPAPGESAGSEMLWLAPGSPLRAAPRLDARILSTLERYTALPFTRHFAAPSLEGEERPANWHRVFHEGRFAWVRVVEPEPGQPPLGRDPAPVRPVTSLTPDPERLDLALRLLGTDRSSGRLGPYLLYTDVTDPYLLQRLSAVAAQIEPIYQHRYGVELVGEPGEAIVVFARRDAYRVFQTAWSDLAGLPAAGHAGAGMLSFFIEGRQFNELVSTLVHELVHLLNRRALGPALPPWLEEGLAEDLTWAEIDPTGRLRPGTWGGDRVHTVERRERRAGVIIGDTVTGGLAVYRTLPRFVDTLENGGAPRLDALFDLGWEDFVRTRRQVHYLQAGLFVRFLLEDREMNPRFRTFLQATAEGRPLTAERFRGTFGMSWEEMETRFVAWVATEASGV